MRWLAVAVVAGCSGPAIGAEPWLDAGQDASPASGGNAQGGAPAGGAAGSGGSVATGGAGGAPVGVGVTVTAKCETVVGSTMWAVASFPGKSTDDLLRVVAWRDAAPEDYAPAGLTRRALASLLVGDGKAGAMCGVAGGAPGPAVTFVLPP